MVEFIPPPDPHILLPPLLACLPTAFASHRPPPALLSLVSPILRQRLQVLTSTSAPPFENWLRLLCWDNDKADKLAYVVENGTYEPHPSSGEIEVGDIGATTYKRLDQETLRAQVVLPEWDLTALYLWCSEDRGGCNWKLAELLPYDSDLEHSSTWSRSIAEANETARERMVSEAIRDAEAAEETVAEQEDDDEYWAQYDKTPRKERSPARVGNVDNGRLSLLSEAEHYAKYGDVQPAMDNHDPSEEGDEIGESSLRGDILAHLIKRQPEGADDRMPTEEDGSCENTGGLNTANAPISQPGPYPFALSNLDAAAKPEEIADHLYITESGIRHHIATTIRSLYRLAHTTGMGREEFHRIVQAMTNNMDDEQN